MGKQVITAKALAFPTDFAENDYVDYRDAIAVQQTAWFKQCRNWVTLFPSPRAPRPKRRQQPPWVWHRGNRTPSGLAKPLLAMTCG
jgi:hypothetical protein